MLLKLDFHKSIFQGFQQQVKKKSFEVQLFVEHQFLCNTSLCLFLDKLSSELKLELF